MLTMTAHLLTNSRKWRRPLKMAIVTSRLLCSSKPYTVSHYLRPSKEYLRHYFDLYVASYDSLSRSDDMRRGSEYSRQTADFLSNFDTVHAYVAEDKKTKELVAGTLLLEIRTDEDLDNLKEEVGETVHQHMTTSLAKYDEWKSIGLYFHKGSFKRIEAPLQDFHQNTLLHNAGIHMYSTIPSIRAKNKFMLSHTPICSHIKLGKEYTFYEFLMPRS